MGAKGVDHHQAKLSERDVRTIRQRHAEGETCKAIAASYELRPQYVSKILRRDTWAHVSDEAPKPRTLKVRTVRS